LAFLQHREPGETRLCPFQDEEFEKLAVVMFRNAPLGVVIGQESRVPESPFAPLDRIVAHPRLLHRCPGSAEAKHRPIQSGIYKLRRIVSSARIEELGDEVRGLAGFLDHREVSGIVDHGEPRSSDPSRRLSAYPVPMHALRRSRGIHAATTAFTQASSANRGSWKTALIRSFRTLFGPGARTKQGRRKGKYIRAVRPGSLGVSPAASRT